MKIGIVKELKPGEGRVGCTPENAKILKIKDMKST